LTKTNIVPTVIDYNGVRRIIQQRWRKKKLGKLVKLQILLLKAKYLPL